MAEQIIRYVLAPYPRCYVYIHFDPRIVVLNKLERVDHVVYVGKGTRARAWIDARGNSLDHRRWLRDLQVQGFSPDEFVRIVKRKLTSEQATDSERELIAFYRNKGAVLFNKERGWRGAVRTYESKWMPDPEFGKLVGKGRRRARTMEETLGDTKAFTEDDFKKKAVRTEDETNITYDLRRFGDRQQEAVAWYLGNLVFRLSARWIGPQSRAVILLLDTKFVMTRQLGGFVKKLKAVRLPIEVRYLAAPAVDYESLPVDSVE